MAYRKIVTGRDRIRLRPTLADHIPIVELEEMFQLRDRYDPLLRYAHGSVNKAWLIWHAGYLDAFRQHPPYGPIPATVVEILAKMLRAPLPPILLPERKATFYAHAEKVRTILGYRKFAGHAQDAIVRWLSEAAGRNDDPGLLRRMLTEKLREVRLLLPASYRIERLIGNARTSAQRRTIHGVLDRLSQRQVERLDGLRQTKRGTKDSVLQWLKAPIPTSKPSVLVTILECIEFIRDFGLDNAAFDGIHPDMRRRIARHIQRASLDTIFDEFPEPKRRAYLACFLHERLRFVVDAAVEVFDDLVQGVRNRSERDVHRAHKAHARSINEKLLMFRTMGEVVLNDGVPDTGVRSAIFDEIPRENLRRALTETKDLTRPADFNCFDRMRRRYGYIRKFFRAFLEVMRFDATPEGRPTLDAAAWIMELHAARFRRRIRPAPLAFVPSKWMPYVCPTEGEVDLRYYEVCVMDMLQHGLQSGDIWAVGGRRYGFIEDLLLPRESWPEQADTYHQQLSLPRASDAGDWLSERCQRLDRLFTDATKAIEDSPHVFMQDGRLHIRSLDAEELPEKARRLQEYVASSWSDVELPDLLLDVNDWIGFVDMFRTLSGHRGRATDFTKALLLTLIMEACNLGMNKIGALAPWANPRLVRRIREQYFYEDSLRMLMDEVVKAFHDLPIAEVLGDETVSMSDGMRLATRVQTMKAAYQPAHLAPGERGLVFYTHVSHLGPAFGAQVIGKERDATYVLDNVLHILSELPIREHYTDTHGFTEIVFALSALFGIDFCPRIKAPHDQDLYKVPGMVVDGPLAGHFKGTIDVDLILEHWSDIVRIVASIKAGVTSAVLLCQRLSSYARQNPLYRAMRELGRLFKTCFMLRYYADPEFRRRINAGMNRAELFNALCRHLHFGRFGQNWERELEEQVNRASALAIVASIVALRNTVYMTATAKKARAEGLDFEAEDLWHVSPYAYEHVIPYGRYLFNLRKHHARDVFVAAHQGTWGRAKVGV